MKIENIIIGGTRLGSWNKVMNAPENWWCPLVWKFNLIVIPTELFLMNWW